jgi:hypothetical protein
MTELRDKLHSDDADPPAELDQAAPAKGEGGGSRDEPPAGMPMHSGTENFPLKSFSVFESDLSARLGVTRRDLVAMRWEHLQEGVDFLKTGRRVVYCNAGIEKLAAAISNGSSKAMLPAGGLSEPTPTRVLFTFKVRRKPANTRVLECIDETGKTVIVRVKDSAHFLPGMKVTAVPYGDLHNVYEFAGAYPRFRGKY